MFWIKNKNIKVNAHIVSDDDRRSTADSHVTDRSADSHVRLTDASSRNDRSEDSDLNNSRGRSLKVLFICVFCVFTSHQQLNLCSGAASVAEWLRALFLSHSIISPLFEPRSGHM